MSSDAHLDFDPLLLDKVFNVEDDIVEFILSVLIDGSTVCVGVM